METRITTNFMKEFGDALDCGSASFLTIPSAQPHIPSLKPLKPLPTPAPTSSQLPNPVPPRPAPSVISLAQKCPEDKFSLLCDLEAEAIARKQDTARRLLQVEAEEQQNKVVQAQVEKDRAELEAERSRLVQEAKEIEDRRVQAENQKSEFFKKYSAACHDAKDSALELSQNEVKLAKLQQDVCSLMEFADLNERKLLVFNPKDENLLLNCKDAKNLTDDIQRNLDGLCRIC